MTLLLYTYSDWQAKVVPPMKQALAAEGEQLLWIGRRSKPLDGQTIRGLRNKNPFRSDPTPFEAEGPLPLLDDPVGFERDHLTAYSYQMSRYARGYAVRGHLLERLHEYRDHFHLTARKIKRMLQRENVSAVLFFNIPHTGDDYLLYRVAENMGLRVILLVVSPFENRFFSTDSIESFGRLNPQTSGTPLPEFDLDALTGQTKDFVKAYMAGTYRREQRSFKELLRSLATIALCCPSLFLKPNQCKQALNEVTRLNRAYKSPRQTRREIGKGARGKKFLNWIGALPEDPAALPDKFIYFPLHLQPEMTTAPQGGVFSDQALALEMLSASLPKGMQIVAKENPKQGGFNREQTFRDRLRQLPNVTVVHPAMESRLLEERCEAVAVITGTAGWEAIRDERPCLCFGHAWYLDCPGVHEFEAGMDLDKVVKNPPRRETNEAFLRKSVEQSHQGVIYEFFLNDDSAAFEARNFEDLVEIFKGLMRGEIETTYASNKQPQQIG